MAIFQKSRFVWNEPWFFQQRIRTAGGWIALALFMIGFGIAGGWIAWQATPAGQQVNWLEVVGLGLGVAACVWWVADGTDSRRQAVLTEDSIIVGGDMGKYSRPETFKLAKIGEAAIVMPEESKWPEPALYFVYDGDEQAIGISQKTSKIKLAQALHDVGIGMRLEGWEPDQESQFERAFLREIPPNQVTAKATMETLPEGTPSMMTPGGIIAALFRGGWAIMIWLAVTGWMIYYAYQNWANIGIWQLLMVIGIPIAVLYVAGTYTDRVASAAASQGLTKMAKDQFRKREGTLLDFDRDMLPIEVFHRDQFDKTVQKIHEMGFLQADEAGKRIVYEGKKERWLLPAASLRRLAIEEVQAGTPGESAMGALNYYVVVTFAGEEGDEEFGFRYSERDYGEHDDVKRAEGALLVYEEIDAVLPPQPVTTGQPS